ncbi:response regulator [Actinoplanes sp. NEAU-A11]|uniref:Response regulator n=1 Tax=Actinoplanes aureus TaxID=2792083 RepID=A0A931CI39_9ACTN|nr:response regulator [Actinoplanes aureus]
MGRILVVDDEPDLRFVLRRVLMRAGHEVVEAGDGAAALAAVSAWLPDLVVTDMMMPVMGGAATSMVLGQASTWRAWDSAYWAWWSASLWGWPGGRMS